MTNHLPVFSRWTVVWYNDNENIEHRQSFVDYEDAVIRAKICGSNCIYDRLEMVYIDLWNVTRRLTKLSNTTLPNGTNTMSKLTDLQNRYDKQDDKRKLTRLANNKRQQRRLLDYHKEGK